MMPLLVSPDEFGVVVTEVRPSCVAGKVSPEGWNHLCVRREDDALRHIHVCSCGWVW